ncbi:hypothetical protein FBY33_0022 [Arthrobacter sp. SLBN-112]|uniref:hypothetical protein n=1 Tax=Arthrobacter sp. SLBN-112 TaxID=2768452 RepID=UPI0011540770|nr:hypothetical protein [Arthrobacter sp. SLBN-112]TQJ38037.1 hypothetical protein FBY33_0022 [Arthrobacter sp. SLBN-112]
MNPGRLPARAPDAQGSRAWKAPRAARSGAARRKGPAAAATGTDLSHSIVQWFAIIAPLTTVATALAFWFGWTMTATRTAYFGIDQSILEYSTVDYLLRSADAIIVPAISILLISLVCIGVHAFTAAIISRPGLYSYILFGAWTILCAGVLITALGVWVLFEEPPFATPFLFEPAALGSGVAVGAYAFWVLRRLATSDGDVLRRLPMWEKLGYVCAVLLVVLALFWACSLYAGALGTGRSREYARELAKRPSVVVYSVQSLALAGPVREDRIPDPDAKYHFKYTGLKFVTRSADKFFLLPEGWRRETGVAIILDDNPEYRVEFLPGG